MKPGKHLYAICIPGKDDGRPQYFVHKCIV
jgi:hypothetical protein